MADKRPYFKVDVGYFGNPKIGLLLDDHPRAILLHLTCIAYATQHATDGVVPMRLAMRQACAEQCDLEMLLQCGLLEQEDTNLRVHDYLEHQRSSSEVKNASDKGRRAAEARWGNAPSMPDAQLDAMQREREREKDSSSPTADAADDQPREDVEQLCQRLADRMVANGSTRPTITKAWRTACRLMIDKDKRTPGQVARMIDWCQADEFWRSNILSMPKLREKYDQLRLKALEDAPKPSPDADWFNR